MAELRMIAVGYKSLPKSLLEEMRKAQIFLGYRRRTVPEGKDEYKLCKAEEVLVADDMESCRTFGDCIFIAPQEELLESKFLFSFKIALSTSASRILLRNAREVFELLYRIYSECNQRVTVTKCGPASTVYHSEDTYFSPRVRRSTL